MIIRITAPAVTQATVVKVNGKVFIIKK